MSSGLVQDMFGGAMRMAFPDASDVELYGSSISIKGDDLILRCGGKEVKMYKRARGTGYASLDAEERAAMDLLAGGVHPKNIGKGLGFKYRKAMYIITAVRIKYGAATNLQAMAMYIRDKHKLKDNDECDVCRVRGWRIDEDTDDAVRGRHEQHSDRDRDPDDQGRGEAPGDGR